MNLTNQIYAQALLLSGGLEAKQEALLKLLCRGASNSLAGRLRTGLTPDDCKADFIAAASLYALAALSGSDDMDKLEQITVGDMTLRRSDANAAANCLRYQADLIIGPYLKDRFSFRGV
ncbi:MAG: hypothetical protein E7466_00705 [Ruminococcaceae bacterium]|nr:hypothetical protein [Oscillospiraceae bacterium]MBQ3214932.1 hypothetical protein [Oscillospiraceae bacterium]